MPRGRMVAHGGEDDRLAQGWIGGDGWMGQAAPPLQRSGGDAVRKNLRELPFEGVN